MQAMRPWRIGLTGGIGSGKSTVAAILEQQGAAVMDADAIARRLTAVHGKAIPAILGEFGAGVIASNGAMDRDAVRQLVFQDPQAKQRLEHILHPMVGQETERLAQQALAQGKACLVFDIPLLVESTHWRQRLDHVLVIDCAPETQIQRVTARNGLAREAVQAIIANQASRATRLAAADTVLFNEGITLDALKLQVYGLAKSFGL
jgi:dephospho-CoA kinase